MYRMLISSSNSNNNDNDSLVDRMIKEKRLTPASPIEFAFRAVNRMFFLPSSLSSKAFIDDPVLQPPFHISAPHMYALVMESLQLSPGLSFLNIGSGTGYLSCLAAHVLGNSSLQVGIERNPVLVEFSSTRFAAHSKLSQFSHISFICADIFNISSFSSSSLDHLVYGEDRDSVDISSNTHEDHESFLFDRVYVGAGVTSDEATDIAKRFLAVGGKMIVPRDSNLCCITRLASGYDSDIVAEVRFAAMVSAPVEVQKLTPKSTLSSSGHQSLVSKTVFAQGKGFSCTSSQFML